MGTGCRATLGRGPCGQPLPARSRCSHLGRRNQRCTPTDPRHHIGRHTQVLRHAGPAAGGVRDAPCGSHLASSH
eukprot:6801115-Pyramimonas_sp.AAC.1